MEQECLYFVEAASRLSINATFTHVYNPVYWGILFVCLWNPTLNHHCGRATKDYIQPGWKLNQEKVSTCASKRLHVFFNASKSALSLRKNQPWEKLKALSCVWSFSFWRKYRKTLLLCPHERLSTDRFLTVKLFLHLPELRLAKETLLLIFADKVSRGLLPLQIWKGLCFLLSTWNEQYENKQKTYRIPSNLKHTSCS